MGKTPNIGLNITPTTENKKFLDWRDEISGERIDSNVMIMDREIGTLKSDLSTHTQDSGIHITSKKKEAPLDTDSIAIIDSTDSQTAKRLSWENMKQALGSTFVTSEKFASTNVNGKVADAEGNIRLTAEDVGGLSAEQIKTALLNKAALYVHSGDAAGRPDFDLDTLRDAGMHKLAGNFGAAQHHPDGAYGDYSVLVTGYSDRMAQIAIYGNAATLGVTMAWRSCGWTGEFPDKWEYTATAADMAGKLSLTGGDPVADMHSKELGLLSIAPAAAVHPTANAPESVSWGLGVSIGAGDIQGIIIIDDTGRGWLQGRVRDIWSPAREIAFATPPQEHDLPLAEGLAENLACRYFKTQDGIVSFYGAISVPNGITAGKNIVLSILPAGYRPSNNIALPVSIGAGSIGGSGQIVVYENGLILLDPRASGSYVYILGTFVAAP